MSQNPLLEIKNLTVRYTNNNHKAVDGISLQILQNEKVSLIGASGCGKSTTAYAIMGLLNYDKVYVSGSVLFEKKEILLRKNEFSLKRFSELFKVLHSNQKIKKTLQELRGTSIGLIFQEPFTSFDPYYTIYSQLKEAILNIDSDLCENKINSLIETQLHNLNRQDLNIKLSRYDRKLSGGQIQSLMGAMAFLGTPQLVMADEPTTSLDSLNQKYFLEYLCKNDEKPGTQLSLLLITHSIDISARYTDKFYVMYNGQILEYGPTNELLEGEFHHPYTKLLIDGYRDIRFVPNITDNSRLKGCRFYESCPDSFKNNKCGESEPSLIHISPNNDIRCWKYA